MNHLKILFTSSEVTPFAKTGGLADVSAALPNSLKKLGHEVIVVMPMYRSVMEGGFELTEMRDSVELVWEGRKIRSKVFYTDSGSNLRVYFIRRDEFFDRSMLYGTSEGDYFDNAERFIFFTQAVILLAKMIKFKPHIIHLNDWQTSLVSVYLKTIYKNDDFFKTTATVFTIHNLAYQGIFPSEYMLLSGLPSELFSIEGLEYYGKMNFMKGGILFSDVITTVSEKYSHEIQTAEFGYGLEGVLRKRRNFLFGVLNGADYKEWNPENDPYLVANYGLHDLSGKIKCKKDLIKIFNLNPEEDAPIIGMVSRLADQKGLDLLVSGVEKVLRLGVSLVILGKGDERYEKKLSDLEKKYGSSFGVKIAFDNQLAHKIEAGADFFLMPSRYEPCGLNQMYSMKYGTIPIGRATGGLDDTIREFNPETGEGNGFKFVDYSVEALIEAVKRALKVYQDKNLWLKLMRNAMKEDFSWEKSAKKYENIYSQALKRKLENKNFQS